VGVLWRSPGRLSALAAGSVRSLLCPYLIFVYVVL
jgi:hypothetical protein